MPDDEGNGRLSRIYPRTYIYIHVHAKFHGPRRFPGSSATVEYARVYTFHSRGRRNLDDTENEPTVWLHIVAAYLCAVHLLRHDVPASNNPVFNGNGLANRPRYTCAIYIRPVTLPLLHSALCISRSCLPLPVSRVSHFQLCAHHTDPASSIPFHARVHACVINVTAECHALGKLNSRKIGRQRDHLSGVRMPSFFVPCCCVVCLLRV